MVNVDSLLRKVNKILPDDRHGMRQKWYVGTYQGYHVITETLGNTIFKTKKIKEVEIFLNGAYEAGRYS